MIITHHIGSYEVLHFKIQVILIWLTGKRMAMVSGPEKSLRSESCPTTSIITRWNPLWGIMISPLETRGLGRRRRSQRCPWQENWTADWPRWRHHQDHPGWVWGFCHGQQPQWRGETDCHHHRAAEGRWKSQESDWFEDSALCSVWWFGEEGSPGWYCPNIKDKCVSNTPVSWAPSLPLMKPPPTSSTLDLTGSL